MVVAEEDRSVTAGASQSFYDTGFNKTVGYAKKKKRLAFLPLRMNPSFRIGVGHVDKIDSHRTPKKRKKEREKKFKETLKSASILDCESIMFYLKLFNRIYLRVR